MLSSWQISQMHAQQGQAFGQQQAYSQQLSSMMPAPYQGVGLGAQGFQGGFGGGTSYNYGGGFSSYGPGNSFGNSMTSMIGGVGHTMGRGMAMAGGIGGFAMGGIGGAMMGMGIGGLVGGAMKFTANNFMEGAHEQAAIERTLSQFQFSNGGSRTGRGFNRQDSRAIGDMVRQMERIPEMLTSFGELNRLMDKMGQMGLMQGVRDAGQFMNKFKETISTVKDLAKMMGTTMEGALQAFGEARSSGFYAKGDIARNVMSRQITASLTGMNQGQIGALQQFGSEMGHGTGGSRASGSRHALRMAGQLGMANQMGILTNDQIMEMTGKEGAEGIQDLSAQMTQLGYRMSNSNVGQALTLALGEKKDGRYTGKMDEELVRKVRSGELSLSELKSLARSKASTRGAKLSFAAHKSRLRSEMAGAVGAEGISMQLQEILGERGWQNPDAVNLVMQRFGASEEQANLLQQVMPNLQQVSSSMGLAGQNQARQSAMNSASREHSWDAIKHRISKKLQHYTTDWAKDLGVGVRDYFQNFADDFLDDISGRYTKEVTKRVSDAVRLGGSGLGGMMRGASGLNLGGTRMDIGSSGGLSGLLARGAHWMGGGTSAGEQMDYIMSQTMGGSMISRAGGLGFRPSGALTGGPLGMMSMIGRADGASALSARGNVVFDSTITGRASGASMSAIEKVRSSLSSGSFGQTSLENLKNSGALSAKELERMVSVYKSAMSDTSIMGEEDHTKRAQMIYQRLREDGLTKMTAGQQALERSGSAAISSLGKLKQKAGMKDLDIVAAIQQQAGGGYWGDVDFGEVAKGLGGIDFTNQKEISKRLKSFEGRKGFAQVKGALDAGGQMGAIALGSLDNKVIADALSRKPETWTDEQKSAMKAAGIDPDKLAAKMDTPEGRKEVNDLRDALKKGKVTAEDAKQYLRLKDAQGLNEIASRFRERGAGINDRIKQNAGAVSELEKTSEGREFVRLLREQGASLSGIKSAADIDNFKDTGALASALGKLSPEQRAAAERLGGAEMQSVAGYQQHLLGRRGRGGLNSSVGKGLESVLGVAGMSGLGFDGAEGEFRKKLEQRLGDNKKLDKNEIAEVVKMLVDVKSKDVNSKTGVTAASTAVSEQEVANTLKVMSENNLKATQILADIAAGKPPGSSASGGASK